MQRTMSLRPEQLGRALAAGAGRALAGVFYAAGRARPRSDKSLHPRGEVIPGRIHRHGGTVSTGVPWLDEVGSDRVLVRVSRSVGLADGLPDVFGLAVRVTGAEGGGGSADGYGDLLLATTGTGTVTRFLLRPTRRDDAAAYSTLLPYRTPTGPLLLAAFPAEGRHRSFDLAWSRLTGPWNTFATLTFADTGQGGHDAPVSFDPVLNTVPGLEPYPWTAQLREFSYAASRRVRRTP